MAPVNIVTLPGRAGWIVNGPYVVHSVLYRQNAKLSAAIL